MYQKFADWVDDVLLSELPEDGVGVCEEIFSTEENNLEW